MWTIKIIIWSTVLFPFLFRKEKNKAAILFSLFLIFFVWAFQYKMTIDWQVYVNRWIHVIYGVKTEDRELEFVYYGLMKICEPITFYGYLIVCAIFCVGVLYIYENKYIKKDLVWMFFLTFSLNPALLLELINSNRQTLAIMFVLMAVYIMSNKARLQWRNKYFALSIILVFCAVNIHTSAIAAVPCVFFPFFINYLKKSKYLYVFLLIDVLSFYVNFSNIEKYVFFTMSSYEDMNSFVHYTAEITERSKSYIEQGIYMGLIILFVHYFDRCKKNEKPIILAALIFLSFQGYAMYTMLRVLNYYRIFVAFAIPIVYARLRPRLTYNQRLISYGIVLFYAVYQFYRFSVDIGGPNYVGYKHFQTLFSVNQFM